MKKMPTGKYILKQAISITYIVSILHFVNRTKNNTTRRVVKVHLVLTN